MDATSSEENHQALFPQFLKLHAEIRALIWEETLPDARIFQVESTVSVDESTEKIFKFYIKHAPPIALSICQESRYIALLRGFYMGEVNVAGHTVGGWFNPQRDILYVDRHQRRILHMGRGKQSRGTHKQKTMQGLERVQNIGIEWRAIMVGTEKYMAYFWRPFFGALRSYMPNLKAVHYILPKVRVKGSHPWAREPHQSQRFDCHIKTLPEDFMIPWGDGIRGLSAQGGQLNTVRPVAPGLEVQSFITPAGNIAYYMHWSQVKQGLELSLDDAWTNESKDQTDENIEVLSSEEEAKAVGVLNATYSSRSSGNIRVPQVIGWKLLRIGAVYEEGDGVYVGLEESD